MKISKKWKHAWRYHFTQVYQKSWDMARDGCNCYFSFWAILFPLPHPLTVQKMKISKKWRNAWRYHHFTQVYQKSWSYAILFLWCVTGVIVILFWAIFLPFYPNNTPKNENFKKMKKSLEISSFYKSAPKIMIICYTVPEIWHVTHVNCYFSFGAIFCPFTP